MLDRAEASCSRSSTNSPEIEAGIPIVGLEPSCVAVFRDELLNLFPHDHRAQALSSTDFPAQRIPRELAQTPTFSRCPS
jgi:hypothetical protein